MNSYKNAINEMSLRKVKRPSETLFALGKTG